MPSYPFEVSIVALTLSGVERLRQAFDAAETNPERVVLLQAAAQLLDRTLPHPALKSALQAADGNPVPALVAGRERIAAVPPGLWRASDVPLQGVALVHQEGWRALDTVLRRAPRQAEVWGGLVLWLEPAWAAYPVLKDECLALRTSVLNPLPHKRSY